MKRSRYCLFFIIISILCLCICSGCSQKTSNHSIEGTSLSIQIKDQIPAAQVGVSYDLSALIQVEDEAEYTFTAQYTDPDSCETKQLNVRNNKITPKAETNIEITVTAKQGKIEKTVDFTVPISISADIIDKSLVKSEADPGVQKSITKDPAHLQASPSTSAIEITFSNPTNPSEGVNLLTLSQYELQAYYTAQVWRNAAVTCWIYNPSDQEITFKLASHNSSNGQTLGWKSADNVQSQIALPGQWTQLSFSLYDMNITQPLFQNPDKSKSDYLKIMARSAAEGSCTLYIDGVDIVHADTLPELKTGYTPAQLPAGDFSQLLKNQKVYTDDTITKLSPSTNGNGSQNAYRFGADQAAGYPSFYIDFPQTTDIRGFDYLKFDVFAKDAYPWVSVAIRYLDGDGNIQKKGVSYNFKVDQWRTLYLNLHSLTDADLSKAVGIQFTIHMDSKFVSNRFNCLYFDNVSLYTYPNDEPQMAPALVEDNDILSAPVYVSNVDPNTCGVVKVATDETGLEKSNSSVLFWANSACGYPTATFYYDTEQDWSNYNVLAFETHQSNAHYWMHFEILYLDEDGKQRTLSMYNDTVFNHWLTTNAPFEWFQTQDGESAKPEHLSRVVGFRITVDLAHNITDEVAYIFFDNFELT